jgi:hypothetical protein
MNRETSYTTENKVRCDACQEMVQAEPLNTGWADGGWILDVDSFGYYGGFHDALPEQATRLFIMCQGCVEKIMSLFPAMTDWVTGNSKALLTKENKYEQ